MSPEPNAKQLFLINLAFYYPSVDAGSTVHCIICLNCFWLSACVESFALACILLYVSTSCNLTLDSFGDLGNNFATGCINICLCRDYRIHYFVNLAICQVYTDCRNYWVASGPDSICFAKDNLPHVPRYIPPCYPSLEFCSASLCALEDG